MKHSYLVRTYNKHPKPLPSKINHAGKFEGLISLNHLSKVIQNHELEVWGISDFLDGLDYHYKNFRKLEKKQFPNNNREGKSRNLLHEVTSYLNRLGQLYTCITADWFSDYVTKDKISALFPSILALSPYRNKYSAHRSLDRPRQESSSELESHANVYLQRTWSGPSKSSRLVMDSFTNGTEYKNNDFFISYQIIINKKDRCKILKEHTPYTQVEGIERFNNNEIFISFHPSKQHQQIMTEAFAVLKELFT